MRFPDERSVGVSHQFHPAEFGFTAIVLVGHACSSKRIFNAPQLNPAPTTARATVLPSRSLSQFMESTDGAPAAPQFPKSATHDRCSFSCTLARRHADSSIRRLA